MSAMKMPTPVQAFFDADKANDSDALVDAFTPDAVVEDEGQSHAGRQAIAVWWHDAKARFQHVIEPLGMSETGGVVEVRTKVTGQFQGSPATLTFAFQLKGDWITDLEIGA
jgi:ketosteroid isomerase-like protein